MRKTTLPMMMTRRQRSFYILVPLTSLTIFVYMLFTVNNYLMEHPKNLYHENNYLEMKGPKQILLDTPGCRIPVEVEPSSKVPKGSLPNCGINHPRFTFVVGNKLIINSTFKDRCSCCFKGIHRVSGIDNETVVSSQCTKIEESEVEIQFEDAIVVICKFENKIFKDYHAIIRKKSSQNVNNVPNIVIIGLDSVSRYHFHKLMPKTKKILEQYGSMEFLGYTKVGENTFPNVIALLTGYGEDQATKFCYNRSQPIDSCPLLWNNLRMTTAFLEDAPRLATFNYFKFGFSNPPTDHYLRPLMLTVDADYNDMLFPCVGGRNTETFILDHIQQLLRVESPLFLYTWLTSWAHENTDNLPSADLVLSNFFQGLNLSNTILIFMSDHGLRYGDTRTSFNGWFNEKLPFLTLTLPQKVQSFLGDQRMATLKSNLNKLTSPFDVYHTLMDILTVYKVKDVENSIENSLLKNFPRTHGQSLFTEIPSTRNCSTGGIPKEFCGCADLSPINMRDPWVETMIRQTVAKINSWLPKRCRQLTLGQITAAAKLNDAEFVVGFTTQPGKFMFEAIGQLKDPSKNMQISRVNRILDAWCVKDWFLELYCYCDSLGVLADTWFG